MNVLTDAMRGFLVEDVEFGTAGAHSLRMDLWRPGGEGPFPAVILVHGGGWISGHRRHSVQPLFAPLEEAGFAWFTLSYRLANDISLFGAAVDDVAAGVRHIREHAARYRVDADRLALVGESAGGHLALLAVAREVAQTGGSGVCAVAAIAAPTDLVTLARASLSVPAHFRVALADTVWGEMLRSGLRELSPINHVRPDLPPILLIHGTGDKVVPYSQSTSFQRRLREVGGKCELYPVEGAGHGLRWWEGQDQWITYKPELVGWLSKELSQIRKVA